MWLVLSGVMVISSTLRLCWPARVVNPRESSSYLQGFHWWKHHEQLGCVSLEPISSENDLWLSTSRTVCGFVDSGVSCSLCCEQISIQILSPFKIWREHSSKLKSSLPGFFCFVFFSGEELLRYYSLRFCRLAKAHRRSLDLTWWFVELLGFTDWRCVILSEVLTMSPEDGCHGQLR